jgi:transposase
MFQLSDYFGFQIIFLPAYSPELNPAEKVFNIVKHHVKQNRTTNNMEYEISEAISKINHHMVTSMQKNLIKIIILKF